MRYLFFLLTASLQATSFLDFVAPEFPLRTDGKLDIPSDFKHVMAAESRKRFEEPAPHKKVKTPDFFCDSTVSGSR